MVRFGEAADASIWFDIADQHGTTDFPGYDTETAEGQIMTMLKGSDTLDKAETGAEIHVVLNQSPFYAESGGRVGDTGEIRTETGAATVTDTKNVSGVFIHIATVNEGHIEMGQGALLNVDHTRRSAIRANHSATHLLHEALRRALGIMWRNADR